MSLLSRCAAHRAIASLSACTAHRMQLLSFSRQLSPYLYSCSSGSSASRSYHQSSSSALSFTTSPAAAASSSHAATASTSASSTAASSSLSAAAAAAALVHAIPPPCTLTSDQQHALLITASSHLTIPALTPSQITSYLTNGYLLLPSILPADICTAINRRIDLCFTGRFETLSYPDEWYWRPELSRADVTRHMCNVWKSDRAVASVLMHEQLGRAVHTLMNSRQHELGQSAVRGVRVGNDSVWVKPPRTSSSHVSYHTDAMYVPHSPTITAWLTLTDVNTANGTLEYARGSHNWSKKTAAIDRDAFHSAGASYRAEAYRAARAAGLDERDVVFDSIDAAAGSVVLHDGNTWHGSAANASEHAWRRSIGVHCIAAESRHVRGEGGYIYSRYQRHDSDEMDPAFFPIIYGEGKHYHRSQFLNHYLDLTDYPRHGMIS